MLNEVRCAFCGKIAYRLVGDYEQRLWCICHRCSPQTVCFKKRDGGLIAIQKEESQSDQEPAFAERQIAL